MFDSWVGQSGDCHRRDAVKGLGRNPGSQIECTRTFAPYQVCVSFVEMATIFLIDDDLASDLLVDNLRQRGHVVSRVSDVDAAVRDADQIAACDLAVLDLVMPSSPDMPLNGVDGLRTTGMRVYQELRKRRADLPILVYTANQDKAVVDIIEMDQHAKYISRWSSPTFREFITVVHKMLGAALEELPLHAFIVHGHDEKTKLEVKNYLQNRLLLPEPIILHEQPNLGRILIEKFEDLAERADLAFIVLTPDDPSADPSSSDSEKRRARQNVIFEMGFFLGMLGRRSGKVFLLYKGPLELPSDLSGVVYIDIRNGVEAAGEKIRLEIEALKLAV